MTPPEVTVDRSNGKLTFESVPQARRHEHVSRQIARSLVRGELRAGDTMPAEAELLGAFNVSRSVIREALRSLEQRGMIESSQGRLTVVLPESRWDVLDPVVLETYRDEGRIRPLLREFLWIRLRLEPEIAAEASRSSDAAFLTDLRAILNRMEALVDQPAAFFAEDMAFHKRLAAEVGNRVLTRLMTTIGDLFNVSRDLALDSRDAPSGALAFHHRIYEAVMTSDEDGARDAMRDHLTWTSSRVPAAGEDQAPRPGASDTPS